MPRPVSQSVYCVEASEADSTWHNVDMLAYGIERYSFFLSHECIHRWPGALLWRLLAAGTIFAAAHNTAAMKNKIKPWLPPPLTPHGSTYHTSMVVVNVKLQPARSSLQVEWPICLRCLCIT